MDRMVRLGWKVTDILKLVRGQFSSAKTADNPLHLVLVPPFYPAQYSVLDWVSIWHVSQSVSQRVSNHFSPHPPPYIELSFSSSICWSIYYPQTSQFQVLEEGSVRTCVAVIP